MLSDLLASSWLPMLAGGGAVLGLVVSILVVLYLFAQGVIWIIKQFEDRD